MTVSNWDVIKVGVFWDVRPHLR